MMSEISTLKDGGMKSLILDLRGNPGGYLHVANQICDEFLKEKELIVFTEGRNRAKKEIYATKKGTLEKIKVREKKFEIDCLSAQARLNSSLL